MEPPPVVVVAPEELQILAGEYYYIALDAVDAVDFGILNSIFAERARRAGVARLPQPIGRKRVRVVEDAIDERADRCIIGKYIPATGRVLISSLAMLVSDARMGRLFDRSLGQRILSAVVHELAHGYGFADVKGFLRLFWAGVTVARRGRRVLTGTVGYMRTVMYETGTDSLFRVLNEAVTDFIAEEVFYEYLQRSGEASRRGAMYWRGYVAERMLASMLVARLAERTGVSTDAVLDALIEGYFTGRDLLDPEMRSFFDEYIYPGFIDVLAHVETPVAAVDLADELRLLDLPPQVRAMIYPRPDDET